MNGGKAASLWLAYYFSTSVFCLCCKNGLGGVIVSQVCIMYVGMYVRRKVRIGSSITKTLDLIHLPNAANPSHM